MKQFEIEGFIEYMKNQNYSYETMEIGLSMLYCGLSIGLRNPKLALQMKNAQEVWMANGKESPETIEAEFLQNFPSILNLGDS